MKERDESTGLKIGRLLKAAYGSSNTFIDLNLRDDKFETAPNFFTFATDNRFMGEKALDTSLWSRQLEIGTRLFGEWCPKCTDKKWFKPFKGKLTTPLRATPAQFQKHVHLFYHGTCRTCGYTQVEAIRENLVPFYDSLIGIVGQRGSKTFTVALIATYLTHRLLMTRNITKAYGLAKGTEVQGVFVATTYKQAEETLWMFYSNMVRQSPWFKEYHAFLDANSSKRGQGVLYKFMDTFLHYRHRNLLFYPSGPNVRTTRGRTRIFSAIDEICYFLNDGKAAVRLDATGVLKALENSLLTVRASVRSKLRSARFTGPAIPITGMSCNISSPVSQRDKGMMLLRESRVVPSLFGFHHPTWELNPTIRKADITEFKTNPVQAEKDFGANPPMSRNTFFGQGVSMLFSDDSHKNAFSIQSTTTNYKGRHVSTGFLKKHRKVSHNNVLAMDAGLVNNGFAFALGRPSEKKHKVVVEAVGLVVPAPNAPIDYNLLYKKIISVVIEPFKVRAVYSDRWQSVKILDDIRADFPSVHTQQYSLKYSDMVNVRDMLYNHEIRMPSPEMSAEKALERLTADNPELDNMPVSTLIIQMGTVVDTGKSVIKSDDISDDLWRAVALLISKCIDPKVIETLKTGEIAALKPSIGQVYGRSGAKTPVAGQSSGRAIGIIRRRT